MVFAMMIPICRQTCLWSAHGCTNKFDLQEWMTGQSGAVKLHPKPSLSIQLSIWQLVSIAMPPKCIPELLWREERFMSGITLPTEKMKSLYLKKRSHALICCCTPLQYFWIWHTFYKCLQCQQKIYLHSVALIFRQDLTLSAFTCS